VSFRVTDTGGRPAIAWAQGLRFTLPHALLERIGWLGRVDARGDLALPPEPARVTAADAEQLREHAAFTDAPPASSRLPFSYQRVPASIRAAIASVIGRRLRRRAEKWAVFPGWPLDLSADLLSDLADARPGRVSGRTPVVLTHDIDSPEGLDNLMNMFLPLEEAAGARSAGYVVPCAWSPNGELLDGLRRRGHEIGVHGYDHGNRTPFAGDAERRARLDAARPFIDRYGAAGYRAPSLLRTRALVRDLASRYRYDSSIPTSGGPFPVANNGCASARPFHIEGIAEIPLTLPRDGSLRFLGYSPREIVRLWIDGAETIARSGGIVVLLTHCEARFSGNRPMLDAYAEFLAHVRGAPARFVFSTPDALARSLPHANAV
jgi:peptidoglycan/xylan/chitin deacetylase (PgdA/CDA1 family)